MNERVGNELYTSGNERNSGKWIIYMC